MGRVTLAALLIVSLGVTAPPANAENDLSHWLDDYASYCRYGTFDDELFVIWQTFGGRVLPGLDVTDLTYTLHWRNTATGKEHFVVQMNPGESGRYEGSTRLPDGVYVLVARGKATYPRAVDEWGIFCADDIARVNSTYGTTLRPVPMTARATGTMTRGTSGRVTLYATRGASCSGRITYATGDGTPNFTRLGSASIPSTGRFTWYPRIPLGVDPDRASVKLTCSKAGLATKTVWLRTFVE